MMENDFRIENAAAKFAAFFWGRQFPAYQAALGRDPMPAAIVLTGG